MIYTKISRELIESLNFRQFTKNDYFGFGGVSSPIPMIAELESEGIILVIDGDNAELYAMDGDCGMDCVDSCESIRDLPYKSAAQVVLENEIAAVEKSLALMKQQLSELK